MNTVNRKRIELASAEAAMILAAAGLMAAAMAAPIRLATAQPVLPTPSTQVSYCNGIITSTLSAASVRVCDPVTVTAVITPVCQGCGGGLNVVCTNIQWVVFGKWMMVENYAALDVMEEWQKQNLRIQGAVVHVNPIVLGGKIEEKVDLTKDLGQVRQKLVNRDGLGGGYRYFGWDKAVQQGIEMLEQDRRDSGLQACEAFVNYACVVLDQPPGGGRGGPGFFARPSRWRRAAAPVSSSAAHSAGLDPPHGLCLGVPAVIKRSSYFEYPERGRLRQMIAAYDGQLTTENGQSLYLWQRLLPGLTYVTGSASVTPTEVSVIAGETVLSWLWTPANQVVPQQVACRVRPAQEGQWPISGEGMIVDKQRRNRLFSMQPVTVSVSGLCETPTPAPTRPSLLESANVKILSGPLTDTLRATLPS